MPEWMVPGYTELRSLGSGGFGEVMLARHEESGSLVAVKYLRRALLDDPEFVGMFRGEAAVLASLEDPNVVRLYECVESPAGAAIVMKLVDGVSVREILSWQGATSAEAGFPLAGPRGRDRVAARIGVADGDSPDGHPLGRHPELRAEAGQGCAGRSRRTRRRGLHWSRRAR